MRQARKDFLAGYAQREQKLVPAKWNRKAYKLACKAERELLGDAVILTTISRHPRTRREKTLFITLGGADLCEDYYENIKKTGLYPIACTIVDTKITGNVGTSAVLCYLSEHALTRMIKRSQCHCVFWRFRSSIPDDSDHLIFLTRAG